jgi:hypothetical protein
MLSVIATAADFYSSRLRVLPGKHGAYSTASTDEKTASIILKTIIAIVNLGRKYVWEINVF